MKTVLICNIFGGMLESANARLKEAGLLLRLKKEEDSKYLQVISQRLRIPWKEWTPVEIKKINDILLYCGIPLTVWTEYDQTADLKGHRRALAFFDSF